MRPRADARLLVPLVMQRHMICAGSDVLQCVSHGLVAPVSSHHPLALKMDLSLSTRTFFSCSKTYKKEELATEARSDQAIEEREWDGDIWMFVGLDETGLHSTHVITRARC